MKRSKTPTFLLELPLAVTGGQARRLRAHFEVARCLYNALLGEALARLPQSLVPNQQELLYRHGRLEALEMKQEPLA